MTASVSGFVRAGKQRARLVDALLHGPKSPSALARRTGLHISNVSRALSELGSRDIVYCLTPELRKGGMYGLTPEGAMRLQVGDRWEELPSQAPQPDLELRFTPRVRGEAMLAGILAAAEILGVDGIIKLALACGYNFIHTEREQWYPMELHHQFLHSLRKLFDSEDLALCREVGRKSVAHLPYMQRFLMARNVDLVALAERAPLVHGHYFNFGRFEVLPHQGGFEIRQFDMLPTREFCAARRGNYEGVLEAKGYVAEVLEACCEVDGDPYCAFIGEVKGLRTEEQV